MTDTVLGVIIIVVVIGAMLLLGKWLTARQKKEVWSGVVVKKWISKTTDEDGDTTTTNNVQFTIVGTGKKKRISAPADLYNSLEVGNKVEKRLGELHPVKV